MSSKRPNRKTEETHQASSVTEVPSRPTGKVPEALVVSRHGTEMVTRTGRGFSFGELAGAGLAPFWVSRWGVPVDIRRRSVLEGNVKSLRTWGGDQSEAKKVVERARKAEVVVVKVAKEVKKVAKKEIVKVEEEVKKEASKVGKRAKAKVMKPKPKLKRRKTT